MHLSRRACLKALPAVPLALSSVGAALTAPSVPADHERRIRWWREAKFGLFLHWGLYSVLGRKEWVMAVEDIPLEEYVQLAARFLPGPNAARGWAATARAAGMKYMVLTTKHHEGFCLFDTELTDYCATKQGPRRDLVREYVDAARAAGLRVGFYYSVMDWHHPDGMRCLHDEAARQRMVQFVHGQVRELLTNYGKIDILWYDMAVPLNAAGWEMEKLNQMVFELQPDILINDRSWLPGDFSTPEQSIKASDRDWESCMTLNESWGYTLADDNWKPPQRVVRNLIECARDGGNFLLNVGPTPQGPLPPKSVEILEAVGRWLQANGASIYGAGRCRFLYSDMALHTRKGNTLFTHVYLWQSGSLSVGGVKTRVKSAYMLATGNPVHFRQDGSRLTFYGLPSQAPDSIATVIAAECESEPIQDSMASRVVDRTFELIGLNQKK